MRIVYYMYNNSTGKYNIVSDGKGGQTTLSRRIVEELLGIELPEYIVVHHMDMDRSNNSIENLMLMTIEEHGKFHLKPAEYVECVCHGCNKLFKLRKAIYNDRKKKSERLYCSRKCVNIINPPPINHITTYPGDMNELIVMDWNNGLGIMEISRKHNWPESAVGYRVSILKSNNIIIDKPKKTIKICDSDVIDIYRSTESIKKLAIKYNVSTEAIRAIKQNRSRTNITRLL